MIRHRVLLPATLAAVLGVAHDASAATIATTRPCLNAASSAQFVATGFTPGGTVKIEMGFTRLMVPVAPDGTATAPFTAPTLDVGAQPTPTAITATDGVVSAAGSSLVAVPGATLTASGPTRVSMHIGLTGFEANQVIYAHLRWNQKWQKTITVGTTAGPCGTLNAKKKLLRKTVAGRKRDVFVQFDNSKTPARDTHQTAYARFRVNPGKGHVPENYGLTSQGWRERTGI